MTAFGLDDDQRRLLREVREVAEKELTPLVERGAQGRVNRPLLTALGEHGLLPRLFSLDAGGTTPATPARVRAMDLCLLREALASVSTEAETALALQGLGGYPILLAGSKTLVRTWVPAIAQGKTVAAFALSEPNAGSDASALELAAEPDGDGWRLSGEKTWISNAPEADVYSVFARTTRDARHRGITAFAVPAHRAGLSGDHLDMLSPHPIGRLTFDGVRMTRDDLLGDVDGGFAVVMNTLNLFRPSVGAFAVGMAQAALDATLRHTGEREAFGGPLRGRQAVAHALAGMATRLEAARLLVYAAGAAYDCGADRTEVTRRSAMAKLYATETAQYVVDTAVQLHGARALRRGHLLEHLYREVRAPRIYEGASEVQLDIIAAQLVKEEKDR